MKKVTVKYGAIGFLVGAIGGTLLFGIFAFFYFGMFGAVIGAAVGYRADAHADLLRRINAIRATLGSVLGDENEAVDAKRSIEQWLQEKQRSGTHVSASTVDAVFLVVSAYVQRTPDLMEALFRAARWSSLEQEIVYLLRKTSLPQFERKTADVGGVAAFLSDAYATQYLIERVATEQGGVLARAIEGSTDLQAANAFVAALLPARAVEALKGKVAAALNASQARQMLAKMMQQSASLQGNWSRSTQGIDFKKQIVRDEVRHELAKDGIYL
jgi:hypothetical protein